MSFEPEEKNTHNWPKEPNEWYVEPEWCSQRLFELEPFEGTVWDPFAGTGRIPAAAKAKGLNALATDLVDRHLHEGLAVFDFFQVDPAQIVQLENIVSNPPYSKNEQVAEMSLRLASKKVALLLPFRWLVANSRSLWLEKTPLRRVLILTPRPSLPPGHILASAAPKNGNIDFAWFIWEHGYEGKPELGWCRRDP